MIAAVRARAGGFCQSVTIDGQVYVTHWHTRGSRDRFSLAMAQTTLPRKGR